MTARWTQSLDPACDEVESLDPIRDSMVMFLEWWEKGYEPIRDFHTHDGSVTVIAAGQRSVRYVQRRPTLTVPDGNGWRRHV